LNFLIKDLKAMITWLNFQIGTLKTLRLAVDFRLLGFLNRISSSWTWFQFLIKK